jgi:hypothetical protein
VLEGDPRADPTVIDLIELAGLWLTANDRAGFDRTLRRLIDELATRHAGHVEFRQRFVDLLDEVDEKDVAELRRRYRRATLG